MPGARRLFAPRSAQLCSGWNQRGVSDEQARAEGKGPGWKATGRSDSEGGEGKRQPDDRSREEVRNSFG